MARAVAAFGVLVGIFTLFWGVAWLIDPPESFGTPYGLGLVIFGAVALYSGFSVLRTGRL